jgi:hypothetical protein
MTTMQLMRLLLATIFFAFHVLQVHAQENRDLSRHDYGGAYTLRLPRPDAEERTRIAEIRDFLWQHWKQRRAGYVDVTNYGIEGQKTMTRYIVEASKRGLWYVSVDMDAEVITRAGPLAHRRDSYVATAIDRVPISDDENSPHRATPIPEEAFRRGDSYQLILKDESGKVLTGL